VKPADVLLVGCVSAFVLAFVDAIRRDHEGWPDLTSWGLCVLALTVLWVGTR